MKITHRQQKQDEARWKNFNNATFANTLLIHSQHLGKGHVEHVTSPFLTCCISPTKVALRQGCHMMPSGHGPSGSWRVCRISMTIMCVCITCLRFVCMIHNDVSIIDFMSIWVCIHSLTIHHCPLFLSLWASHASSRHISLAAAISDGYPPRRKGRPYVIRIGIIVQ